MKYRIVGADGKIHGPVGLEQIRQWLAEGRADGRTPVYVEGSANWSYLGLLPELASHFAATPQAAATVVPTAAMARGTNGFATAGLICGLLSWTCCCCPPFSLIGLICSIIALVQINSQAQPQEGRVLAIIGLILSAANLLFGFAYMLVQFALGSNSINWQLGQ